ncbi:MAG: hypothetical protein ACI4TK_17820 [Agathobacter sp.]
MTREEARKNAEVMCAYSEGKAIEILLDDGTWGEMDEPDFDFIHNDYRVKKEPSYRPFLDVQECFNEMMQHHPFGWVYCKQREAFLNINRVVDDGVVFDEKLRCSFVRAKNYVTFVDGEPFGIEE